MVVTIWIVSSVLYFLAVLVTGRILARTATKSRARCIDRYGRYNCDKRHWHYIIVIPAVIAPIVWLYWLSGAIVNFPELSQNRKARQLAAAHERELAVARHKVELAKAKAEETEAIDRQLKATGHEDM